MREETKNIKTRHDQQMSLKIIEPDATFPVGTVIIQHGRGGNMESLHNQAVIEGFLESQYKVIALDATNSDTKNKSTGDMTRFTIDQHVSDFEDTVEWANINNEIEGVLAFAGHSMGGFSAIKLAMTTYANHVNHVFAYAPVISGQQQIDAKLFEQPLNMTNGAFHEIYNEQTHTLTTEQMNEWKNHDLRTGIGELNCPLYIVTGRDDTTVLAKNVSTFSILLPNGLNLVEYVSGADHSFSEKLSILKSSVGRAVTRFNSKPALYLENSAGY